MWELGAGARVLEIVDSRFCRCAESAKKGGEGRKVSKVQLQFCAQNNVQNHENAQRGGNDKAQHHKADVYRAPAGGQLFFEIVHATASV